MNRAFIFLILMTVFSVPRFAGAACTDEVTERIEAQVATLLATTTVPGSDSCRPDPNLPAQKKSGFTKQISKVTYGPIAAEKTLNGIGDQVQSVFTDIGTQNPCMAGCHRNGDPQAALSTQPIAFTKDSSCPQKTPIVLTSADAASVLNSGDQFKQTATGFSKEFSAATGGYDACQKISQDWVVGILTSDNALGKAVVHVCPDQCGYISVIRTTVLSAPAGGCHLGVDLDLSCSQPRDKSFMDMGPDWVSSAVVTNNYTCEKDQ